ncbi:MAG: D-alanyl-D-alanine carboxypeptidase family protein, partial [Paracoccaceae bacterium]
MDAATGETLFSKNADTRLHPASLTKMMTLYVTFGAVESGEISVDKMVTISQNAASEPPSKLGLRKGQKITLRYLIRAAAIKSANDAATAIGEAVSGSESAFAKRMTRTAKALGMLNSQFKNANGLTKSGHYSTAHDMSILGWHLFYDYPDYYHLFSRREIFVGVAKVRNTNRRFLAAYRGADGIKTGYTNAAGYNLTASAQHGNRRIIASVFGATSTPNRNLKMAKLLNLGFSKKATGTKVPLAPPAVLKDIKSLVLTTSPRPKPRPLNLASTTSLAAEQQTSINAALQEAAATTAKNAAQNQIFHIQNQNVIAPTFVPYTTAPLTKINWPPENT